MLRSNTLLSDHMPFIAKSNQMNLLSWNMLCKMKFNTEWKYFNNGFSCHKETKEQYTNRLSHVAARIAYAAENNQLDFICLQECPEKDAFRAQFEVELKQRAELKNYALQYYNNIEDEYFLITLYDNKRYTINSELTEKISIIRLEEGLEKRILPLVLSHHDSKEMVLVINVHANFGKTVKKDIQKIVDHAKQLGIHHIAFLGDFNRDLTIASDNYSKHDISEALDSNNRLGDLYVNSLPASSFIAKYNSDNSETRTVIETRDGIVSNFLVETTCKTDINVPDPVASFTKKISPRLNNTPDGLLKSENLLETETPKANLSIKFGS